MHVSTNIILHKEINVSMYVQINIIIGIHAHINTANIKTYIYIHMYIYICTNMFSCMHAYMYICILSCMCIYIFCAFICVCAHACVCARMCVYVYKCRDTESEIERERERERETETRRAGKHAPCCPGGDVAEPRQGHGQERPADTRIVIHLLDLYGSFQDCWGPLGVNRARLGRTSDQRKISGYFYELGAPSRGALTIRALVFGVHIRAPNSWKLPRN